MVQPVHKALPYAVLGMIADCSFCEHKEQTAKIPAAPCLMMLKHHNV